MPRPRQHKRGNGEGSIFRRSDGRWACSITTGFDGSGRQARKDFYGKTRGEVLKKQHLKAIAEGTRILREETRRKTFNLRRSNSTPSGTPA